MTLTKKISTVACGLLLSQSLWAEDFEKKSPIHLIDPDAYGDFQVRYYRNNFEDPAQINGDYEDYFARGKTQVRFMVGSRFFEDRLNLAATFGGNVHDHSTQIVDRGTRVDASFDLWSDDIFSVTPYAGVSLPHQEFYSKKDHETRVKVGLNTVADYEVSTAAGVLDFSASVSGGAYFFTKDQQVTVKDSNGDDLMDLSREVKGDFALTTENHKEGTPYKVSQQSPKLSGDLYLGVAYKPSFVGGLRMDAGYLRLSKMNPVHRVNEQNKTEVNYQLTPENYGTFNIAYVLSDRVTLKNSAFVGAAQQDGTKLLLENMTTVSMELF